MGLLYPKPPSSFLADQKAMQRRVLGNTDLEITTVGLGTWAIGGGDWLFGWGDQDEAEAIATIQEAVEVGVNWIDTAPVYGLGRSEQIVGKALQQIAKSDWPLIATKCGRTNLGNGEIGKCLKHESVIAECEGSLQRLGVDCIDLYQMHWPEPDVDIEEGWQALVALKQQGKVRHIGVSNHSVAQLERLQAIHPVASLQPPYSLIARDVEQSILPHCHRQDIGVICYSPMGKGLLTGTFTEERVAALSQKDHRSRDPRFQSPQLEINLGFVRSLETLAQDLGWTVPELAIAWTLSHPALTAAIVGARRPNQITQTATASDRVLDSDASTAILGIIADRDQQLAALGDVLKPRV